VSPSRRIEVEIIGDARSLKAALGTSAAGLQTFEARANRLGRTLTTTGRTMTRNITLPILGIAAASTKMALDYDRAINHVQALTGASAKQTKAWSDQLLKLAPRVGQSPQQLADALYFVASSGAKVNQVMPITTASAKLAAAGMGDAQVVAQLLTSAMNAYGAKALSAAKASDILTEAVKIGKAEPQDLADSLGRVIPISQAMGVTFAEAATSVSELTNTGLNADEAATSLRATLSGLLKPASQTEKAMHKIGLSAAEVRQEVRDKGLNATLQDMARRVGDNDKLWGQLFPNVRAMTGVLALTGRNADQVSAALDKVEHSTGAATKAFNTAQKGPAQQFQRELAQIEATAIRVGNDLLPVVLDVLTTVGDLADKFDHLSDSEKTAIEIGLGVAALSGPLLTVGGNVVKLIALFGKLGKVARIGGAATAAGEAAAGGAAAGAGGVGAGEAAAAGAGGAALAAVAAPAALVVAGLLYEKYFGSRPQTARETLHMAGLNAQGMPTGQGRKGIVLGGYQASQYKQTVDAAKAEARYWNVIRGIIPDQKALNESITAGGMSVTGWKEAIGQATDQGTRATRAFRGLAHDGFLSTKQAAADQKGTLNTFIGQMRAIQTNATQASHDTEHFGAAARAEYKHVAALARTSRELANAINAVPSQKYVSLVLSITTHLRTEGLAPGMGPESTRQGPGGSYKPGGQQGTGYTGPRASGGVIMAGRSYIVGDTHYPEIFESDVPGHIRRMGTGSGSGGWVEVRFTDWERGIGMMRRAGDAAVADAARRRRQRVRMGAE
jgi:TP901 family phage tail tape measure protein